MPAAESFSKYQQSMNINFFGCMQSNDHLHEIYKACIQCINIVGTKFDIKLFLIYGLDLFNLHYLRHMYYIVYTLICLFTDFGFNVELLKKYKVINTYRFVPFIKWLTVLWA